ncbi:MAG: tetratricopeptide repeat protein [Isosphaeraceae bacterium]
MSTLPERTTAEPTYGPEWVEQEVAHLADAWARGERISADELLARYPGIDDESAVRLIFEEACLRRDAGLEAGTLEVVRRYPRWRKELEPLLAADRLMRPPGAAAHFRNSRSARAHSRGDAPTEAISTSSYRHAALDRFPETGDRLGDFRLLAELGRGGAGRTFLAVQPSLADRPVVLKVTAGDHVEHLSLARLMHTHIVPLYSEQAFPDRGLRALCMPYLGGTTLAQILDELAGTPPERRRGRDVLQALDQIHQAQTARLGEDAPSPSPPTAGPFRVALEQATYVEAVCWIAACLADALQYAHDRGLVHMDVKPSNVLIASDGQPMLLDFHLAVSPIRPGERSAHPAHERLGGTRGWMSPEQSAAMAAVIRGGEVRQPVDGRSDIYSLGLLIDEALGGTAAGEPRAGAEVSEERPPVPPGERTGLNRRNPKVSVGLSDIVARCLEPDARRRYQSASALAEDLRRHLDDEPLVGVPNRSVSERWRKWRRRSPYALTKGSARAAVMVALAAASVLVWGMFEQRARSVSAVLDDARRYRAEKRFEEAQRAAEQGEALARWLPFSGPTARELDRERRRALRSRRAQIAHEVAERVRFQFGAATTVTGEMRELAPRLRKLWQERGIFAPAADGGDRLSSDLERRLDADRLELAVSLADLLVRLAPAVGLEAARREAYEVLGEAEREFGASPALARDRQALAGALGLPPPAAGGPAVPAANSAGEHYELGRSYLRSNQVREAEAEFARALVLRPQDFWPNFYQGMCAYRQLRDADALAAFRVCVTLAPDKPECRVNRALVYERLGRNAEARADYDWAVDHDLALAEARLCRGRLKYRLGQPREAAEDFRQALASPLDDERAGVVRYNLALAYAALGDHAAAAEEARRALELGRAEARALLVPSRTLH